MFKPIDYVYFAGTLGAAAWQLVIFAQGHWLTHDSQVAWVVIITLFALGYFNEQRKVRNLKRAADGLVKAWGSPQQREEWKK
jgi:cation transport ATPase